MTTKRTGIPAFTRENRQRIDPQHPDACYADCCPLHRAAPDLLAALRAILFQVRQGKVLERDACVTQAVTAIRAAQGGEGRAGGVEHETHIQGSRLRLDTMTTKKKAQHTKGPWRLASHGLGTNHAVFAGETFWCVADCNAGPEEEREANARLMAKAPELASLLLESREFIGGDWRERRDNVLREAGLLTTEENC